VCTYTTERVAIRGSGKVAGEWSSLASASVYVDHPYATPLAHTLNVDLFADAARPARQIALELSVESAEALIAAVSRALDDARRAAIDADVVTAVVAGGDG
jgi:Family of unknown function (DUF6295)